jgi:hypothetical protein
VSARQPPLRIASVSDHRHPHFTAALRLYNRVFPSEEKVDRRYFRNLLEEKRLGLLYPFNVHFLVAVRGERVIGLATGSYLAVVNVGFVGYLAVGRRSAGAHIGTRLRHRLVADLRRDAQASGNRDLGAVMGEVERDNPWLRHLIRDRRVFALDLDYRQPPLHRQTHEVPLVLYVEPVGRPFQSLRAADVRLLLYAIYRRLYRIRFPLRAPSFVRMLRQLEGRRVVGRLSLAQVTPSRPARRAPRRKAAR